MTCNVLFRKKNDKLLYFHLSISKHGISWDFIFIKLTSLVTHTPHLSGINLFSPKSNRSVKHKNMRAVIMKQRCASPSVCLSYPAISLCRATIDCRATDTSCNFTFDFFSPQIFSTFTRKI